MLVVITPNANRDLTTVAAVKADLGIVGSVDIDAKLAIHITQASNLIAEYCNRVFAIETVEETLRHPSACDPFILSRYPVVAITSVVEGGKTLHAEDYEVDKASGIVLRQRSGLSSQWASGSTKFTYIAGYELPASAPPALVRAAIEMVKQSYYAGGRDPMIRSDTTEGVGSTEYFNTSSRAITGAIADMLEPYRKVAGS